MAGFSARPVPLEEYQPRIPVEEGLRRVIPQRTGINIGPATEDLGRGVQAVATSEASRYVMDQTSAAQQQWMENLKSMQEKAPAGAPGFTPQVMTAYGDYVKQAVKGAPNPIAGRLLQQQLQQFGLHLQNQSLTFEANSRHEHNVTTAQQSAERSAGLVQNDPNQYDTVLSQQVGGINGLNLDGDTKEKLAIYAKERLSTAAVAHDIQHDPYAAMQALANTSPTGYYADLTVDQRNKLQTEADRTLHERVADAERVHNLAKQQEEDTSKNLLRQGLVLSQKGGLTTQWVLNHASALEPQALRFLLDDAAGKTTVSDPHVYADLLTRANHGEDVTEEAKTALYQNKLDKSDFTRVTDMGAKDIPNVFRQGDDYIRTSLGSDKFAFDEARQQMLADARNEWIDWNRDHRGATQQEAERSYQDITRRHQLIQATDDMLRLPVPEHFVGTRTAPDLDAWAKNLGKALNDGTINRDQFNREALTLSQWREATEKAKARTAAAKAKEQQ